MQLRKITLALIAAGTLGTGGFLALHHFPGYAAPAVASVPAIQAAPAITPARPALPDFASIARQYGPAVVNISVSGTTRTGMSGAPDNEDSGNDPFFRFFRGLPFDFQFQVPRGGTPMRGEGSGFIVNPDGVILTNAHVVRDASEVTVRLTDRRELHAKVLGLDLATDIAVLRVDAKNLPSVHLGDPRSARVGDWVVAIGSPFGFANSVTAGIVSAKGRALPGDSYVPFLQTDVAVNPGNSGGPLFNMAGEVIGINSQIYSRSGGYQGVSFAIPIDVAAKVKDQIVASGHATHARLGVTIQDVNQALADAFALPNVGGALVSSVQPGSAGSRAGLQPGDVIVDYDGQAVVASTDLSAFVAAASPGEAVRLKVVREGKTHEFVATLGSAGDGAAKTAQAQAGAEKGGLGLAVRALTPEERREAKIAEGLLVEGVANSAERSGVQPGDIIVSANGKPVKNVAQLREIAAHASKSIALLVQRGDARIFIPIRVG